MEFRSGSCSKTKMFFSLVTFIVVIWCSECSQSFPKTDEIATVIGKSFSYKLPIEVVSQSGCTFKPYASGSHTLPSWLSFDEKRNILVGIPSHHDKGRHEIKLHIINKETNRTVNVLDLLFIDVVLYHEDLNHYNALKSAPLPQNIQNRSETSLDCPGHQTVIIATLVFDLNVRKLSGAQRVELLRKVAEWLDIGIEALRFIPGKGEKTAFHLKDVIFLTGGPGSVDDPQERGVSVSWKIGCGESVAANRPVSRLKSASEMEEFKKSFDSPVSAWHVAYGMLRHRQVVRVRRAVAPVGNTPIPTSSLVTASTRVIAGTPIITSSPTATAVLPTSTIQVSPSPTKIPPSPAMTPIPNTPPQLINPIGTLTTEIDVNFRYPVPPNTFHDREDGDTPNLMLEYFDAAGNPFPDDFWLKFNPGSQTFVGTPTKTGKVDILLVATDKGLLKATDIFTINIVLKNDPPKLINHIDLIKHYVGQPIKLQVPYDTFYDEEDGDTTHLTLSMTTIEGEPLPSWVSFDVATQTIYALPMEAQLGKTEFLMIATDKGRKSARDAFEFHVFPSDIELDATFGLVLDAPFEKFKNSAEIRVNLCIRIGEYFGTYFNITYRDLRVRSYKSGSVYFEWNFVNVTEVEEAEMYKKKYVIGDSDKPVEEFEDQIKNNCPIQKTCPVEKVYVRIEDPNKPTPGDPNIIARAGTKGGGTWWKYTLIPAIVVAAIVFIIGLIIIICIRCRRRTEMEKSDKVVFLYRKKPAVFREEYPMKEMYGDQPLITPSEKPPLPPPAYPRSSTPTEDPNAPLLSDNSPSYQPPSFDNGPEQGPNARTPVSSSSFRLPPPYVAP